MAIRLAPWLLLAALLCAAPAAHAQDAPRLRLQVGGSAGEQRAVVVLNGLLDDPALREALESGLPLRFHFRIELWRNAFFDRLAGAQESYFALVQDPIDRRYLLDTGASETRYTSLAAAESAIARLLRPTLSPDRRGSYYYLANLEIETLSLSDLEELRRWLRGELQPAVEGSGSISRAMEQGLRRAVVRLMGIPTRAYEARSPGFTVR